MLVSDTHMFGNRILAVRKRLGLTQEEAAERANISERSFSDIERGLVNTRIDTLLQICKGLNITPDVLLTTDTPSVQLRIDEAMRRLELCTPQQRDTALRLLEVYFDSLTPPATEE